MQKLKETLRTHKEEVTELVRYVIAGGLTTLLSLAISYGCYILFSAEHTINGANTQQVMISNIISWIICVVFAFWINRKMVFRVSGEGKQTLMREFFQFAGARVVSLLLFEEGLAALLKMMGMTNFWNRLVVLVVVTVFNYVASKFWIFAKNPQEANSKNDPQ